MAAECGDGSNGDDGGPATGRVAGTEDAPGPAVTPDLSLRAHDGVRIARLTRYFMRASSASAAMNPNGIQFGPVTIFSKIAFASAFLPL